MEEQRHIIIILCGSMLMFKKKLCPCHATSNNSYCNKTALTTALLNKNALYFKGKHCEAHHP